ncbi:glycosyltransferase family 4 protein [Planctomonas sp. JC2975]|uniref:glycosyltransferase family 4 protein n=1 Tax=Planctomonas sp. JC2975 TaxID=2729626 RepID=UPI001475E1C8|nr:glycosyltransferase family 4 protein [Planctomonas sp. JC2975]NNC12955.1 glycosyltransferase family 4 protein [Planctomonas sp. JC2975]
MRILISSWTFAPSVGGVETTADLLARHFVKRGHSVVLVTAIVPDDGVRRPYRVIRRPSPILLLRLVAGADVYFHNGMSVKMAWPLLFFRRPWVVAVRLFFEDETSRRERIRHFAHRFASLIANSHATAGRLPYPSTVVYNGVRRDVFRVSIPTAERDPWRIIAAGRLVRVKGFDLLIEAFARLRTETGFGELTIVGSGPEREALTRLADSLGISQHVDLVGPLAQDDLAGAFNAHAVAVVPSRWDETFGNVALEAIASGCAVITTNGGGLPEAVGPCGRVVDEASIDALHTAMKSVVGHPDEIDRLLEHREEHVSSLSAEGMGDGYLAVLREEVDRAERDRRSAREVRRRGGLFSQPAPGTASRLRGLPRRIRLAVPALGRSAYYGMRNRLSRRVVTDPDSGVDVSMATYGPRIRTVHLALESIAAGKVRPRRMILWIADSDFRITPGLRRLMRRGLEVASVPSALGPHAKWFPYTQGWDGWSCLVTADDDLFYPSTWLSSLERERKRSTDEIVAHRTHRVAMRDGAIQPYRSWAPGFDTTLDPLNFPTGGAGCLFPPAALRALAKASTAQPFLTTCPRQDDIWLHSTLVGAGLYARQLTGTPLPLHGIPGTGEGALLNDNVLGGENDNAVARAYGPDMVRILTDSAARDASGHD